MIAIGTRSHGTQRRRIVTAKDLITAHKSEWLETDQPPQVAELRLRSRRLLRILLVQVLDKLASVTGETGGTT